VRFSDRHLEPVWEKVQAGQRLTREDGLRLLEMYEITEWGAWSPRQSRD